jgi:hypothetical protein
VSLVAERMNPHSKIPKIQLRVSQVFNKKSAGLANNNSLSERGISLKTTGFESVYKALIYLLERKFSIQIQIL